MGVRWMDRLGVTVTWLLEQPWVDITAVDPDTGDSALHVVASFFELRNQATTDGALGALHIFRLLVKGYRCKGSIDLQVRCGHLHVSLACGAYEIGYPGQCALAS